MEQLTGNTRRTFMENAGRQSAGTGHFSEAGAGFAAFRDWKPLASLNTNMADYADFRRGFQEVQELRILVMLTKAKAQADNSMILKELEGKGMTFLQERVKSE